MYGVLFLQWTFAWEFSFGSSVCMNWAWCESWEKLEANLIIRKVKSFSRFPFQIKYSRLFFFLRAAAIFCLTKRMLLVQALNLIFTATRKKCVLANFWFLVWEGPYVGFLKNPHLSPLGIFFRSNCLHWSQQKLKRLISQQEKSYGDPSMKLWNKGDHCVIPICSIMYFFMLIEALFICDVSKNHKLYDGINDFFIEKLKLSISFCSKGDST